MRPIRSDTGRCAAAPAAAVVSLEEWRARRAPIVDGAPALRVLPGGAAAPGVRLDPRAGGPAEPGLRLDRFLARAAHVLAGVESGGGATVVPLERRRRGARGGGHAVAGGSDGGGPLATA